MKSRGFGLILVFFVLCESLEDEVCPRKHHALLIALLPLHKGYNCRELVQKGVQQKVALERTLETVNADNELQIGLKILDTCSSKEKAVESSLKAVALAEKRCSKFPVFLGYLGPDDEESLRGIIGIYKDPHVVPASTNNFQHTAIAVEVIDKEERARRIAKFLKYLKWYSFILVYTSDTLSSYIATYLLASDEFCLVNTVLRIPSFGSNDPTRASINRLRRAVEEVQNVRMVIVTDDADVMGEFTDYQEEDWGDFEYVIYVQKTGLLPWKLSKKMYQNAIILHEVRKSPMIMSNFESVLENSTLWTNYITQIGAGACEGCEPLKPELDPTVIPYEYSLHLFSRALKTATRKKCGMMLICDALKTMTAAEWKAILEDTVTLAKAHKLQFYMNLESGIDIIVHSEDQFYEIVGSIRTDVIVYNPTALKRSNRSKTKQCLVDLYDYELEPEVNDITTQKMEGTTEKTEQQNIPLYFGYNELMATVISFPIGLVILIVLIILCVVKTLRNNHGKTNLTEEDYS